MKAILMSIKPKWVKEILNGNKTIEIRKKFPKDYVGWVYIYCTKDRKQCLVRNNINKTYHLDTCYWDEFESNLNGKVVARFWCDKVEKIHCNSYGLETSEHWYRTTNMHERELLEKSCLTFEELDQYLCWNNGCAIHITKLEIFDKPKEISEFKTKLHIKGGCKNCPQNNGFLMPYCKTCDFILPLTRAPQSWCYIEI